MRKKLRRKVKTILLGDSLSSNLLANDENTLILSWPNTPSSLDGLNFSNLCIDRIPMYAEDPECLNSLGLEAKEVVYDYVLIGEEEALKDKIYPLNVEATRPFWYDMFPVRYSKLYYPKVGWCSVIKTLRKGPVVSRIYSNITEIDPLKREVRIEGGSTLEYEKLVSTIPQDLLVSKLRKCYRNEVLGDYIYVPYHISAFIGVAEQGFGDYEALVYALGRRRFISSHMILAKHAISDFNPKHVLVYVLTPLKRDSPKSEILSKNVSELGRVGIKVRELLFLRSYIEKYGVICERDGESSRRLLAELGIEVRGRYGSWSELSICDIVKRARDTNPKALPGRSRTRFHQE